MKRTNKQNVALALVAVAILAGVAWTSLRAPDTSQEVSAVPKNAGVLSPSLFQDEKTRAAYQVAMDIPEVLEQLPCFCGCMTSFDHKNNLFCFKDQHGSGCSLCQDIALEARQLHDRGKSITQIQDTIKEKYSRVQE